ncbi:MAG TPA: ABC transporter ATP-binding protein [Candidatus Scybalocola faecavium]|nr:ABC transporter ATP-binding protein [Candidatus Scybalocola faecavium]
MENNKYTSNHPGKGMNMRGPGMHRGSGEKARDFTGTWKKLIIYCKRYLIPTVIAVICAIGGTIFTLIGPDKLSDMTEVITRGLAGSVDLDAVGRIGFTLLAFYLCSIVLSFTQHFIMTTISQMVSQQMRSEITRKINRLPMSFYSHTSHGDILSRVTNDVDTISMSLNQSVGMLVSAITLFFGSLIMMFITNVIMAITAVVAIIIGFCLMRLITAHSQKYFARQQRHLGELNGHIEEVYSGHTVIKAYNDEANAKRTFDEMNNNLKTSAFRAQSLAGLMQPLMVFIGNLGYVAVCVVGAVLTMNDQIGFEVIVAFMMYVRFFTQPLSQIAQAIQSLQSGAAAGERVFEFLEAKEMENEDEKTAHLEQAKGYVEFDHVKFGYDPDKIIIHDFSAKASPGQKIAIVGPTGAGKTTLVNLLMRFYEIQGGDIRIDGISTKSLKREDVHSQFCMVLQDTWLFEGTVRENLIYCSENVSEEKMEAACKAVGLDHFIHTLPHGYDTILNDQLNLSQGQKQQLTIARAMIADKPMLILDEATSSVDTRTELQIQNAMDALMKGRTSFVIAHRLSTIKNSDLILVLKDGDVIESGTHDELLAKGGFYADLYNSQFDKAS